MYKTPYFYLSLGPKILGTLTH